MSKTTALLFALALAGSASAAEELRVPGKAAAPRKSSVIAQLHDAAFPSSASTGIVLGPVKAELAARIVNAQAIDEKRVRVGMRRDIAMETAAIIGPGTAQWVAAPGGGFTARLAVTSPGAASLRLGLHLRNLPASAELRFADAQGARIVGPVAGDTALAAARAQGVYWTPLTEGETQVVEIWIPAGTDPAAVGLEAETASHLAARPSQLFKLSGPGAAQACNEDVACAAPANPAIAQAARSVAKLVYTENGATYLCSGTLINDGNASSEVPYLYTAAHCIGSQAAAASLNTFWFYEASPCGAKAPVSYRQLSDGATLLYANHSSDVALVRLNDRAPEGAWFAGWDATPLGAGMPLVALHHPAGDLKKLSLGRSLEPTTASGGASYDTAAWSTGSTEGGSSGSGLFTLSGNEYLLRGGLRGGSASCASSGRLEDPSNRDYYSRLDLEAAALRTWLAAGAAPLEDYTGMWWNPAEPGWGLAIMQNAANRVFATWYVYDAAGQPTWLVLPEGEWKGTATLEGTLYRTSGTPPGRSYDPTQFSVKAVGTGRIEFGQNDRATLSFSVDGQKIVKTIQRLG